MIPGCLMNNIPPAWNGLISARTASAPPCTYTVGVLYLSFVCLRRFCSLPTQNGSLSKSSAAPLLSMSSNHIWDPKNPEKIAQKNLKTMSWWWLTDWGPRVTMVVGLDLDTNRHGIPIPQGWITPTTRNTPLWIIPPGRTKRQFCSDLWNDQHHISPMLLADRHHWLVPPKDQSNPCVPTRKENSSLLRYLILYSLMQASANGNQGYILHKILVFTFYYAIITLPIPYYKKCVIHGIIAHKQTNLIYG